MSRYNLRNHGSPRDSDGESKSSPRIKRRAPKSPNMSGYSSSYSNRDQSSLHDDEYNDITYDSQDEDEVDSSYPSTTFSPTASTPSPRQRPNHKGIQDKKIRTPPKIYPNLSDLSDKTPSPPKERKAKSPEHPKKIPTMRNNNNGYTDIVMYIVLGVVFIGIMWLFFPGSPPKTAARTSRFQEFVSKVEDLQTNFKSQEKRTWKSIKSSVKHILNSTVDPEYPAVVMFAVRKDFNTVGSCLARRVASLFNFITRRTEKDGYLDARLLSHLESAKQKEDLDEKIQANFKKGRSVVIDHLEALSPTASLLLHGICDNDNAPFKDVFIGIVFYVDKSLKAQDVDTELERYFLQELDMDKIGALLTRINNNAVVVMKEDALSSCD